MDKLRQLIREAIKAENEAYKGLDRYSAGAIAADQVAKEKPFKALIGIIARELVKMESEEAFDTIDRLMLYLKDAKADIEYKDSLK